MSFRLHAEDETGRPLTWAETARVRGLRMLLGQRFQACSADLAARLASTSTKGMPSQIILVMSPDVVGCHPNLAA